MGPAAARNFVQNCYVVSDLYMACVRWRELFGIGPFVGGGEVVLSKHFYRGQAVEPIKLRGVFVQSGKLNVELVQIISDGPSAFHDMFKKGEEGLHHCAMFTDDYEGEKDRWIAAGLDIVSEFTTPFGAEICYVDARPMLGHFIEIYPENPIIRAMYAQAEQEARDWNGQDIFVPWR